MNETLWIHTLPNWLEWVIIFAIGHLPFTTIIILGFIGWIMTKFQK